jgi:hypothetical protein
MDSSGGFHTRHAAHLPRSSESVRGYPTVLQERLNMTTKAASEEALGDLHSKVAKVMTRALEQHEKAQDAYEAWEPAEDDYKEPPELNPALLSVAVRFLDANKITCAPAEGNKMGDLEKSLADKRNRRRAVGNVTHIFDNE